MGPAPLEPVFGTNRTTGTDLTREVCQSSSCPLRLLNHWYHPGPSQGLGSDILDSVSHIPSILHQTTSRLLVLTWT